MTGLSPRALVLGALLGALLAATAMYSGSRTSVVDGGNLPAALLGLALLAPARRRPTADEGNLIQTVASSAAYMAMTGGFLGPLAALALAGHAIPMVAATAWGVAVGVAGCLFAVPLRAAFVVRGRLPFPSATAVATVIDAAYAQRTGGARIRVLVAGALVAATVATMRDVLGWLPELTVLPITIAAVSGSSIALGVGWSPLLLAVGAMLGARMALALVLGVIAAWVVLAPVLVGSGTVPEAGYLPLLSWLLWPGVGLMLGGTLAALLASWRTLRAGLRELDELRPGRGYLIALGLVVLAVVVLGDRALGVSPAISALALGLAAILCAAAGQATGETDNTPAGAFGGLGQLVVGAIAPGGVAAPLAAGGVIQGTVMHASVMLGNWRTGLRLGAAPGPQLVAQLVGVVVGAITSAAVFELMRRTTGLATQAMPAPIAQSWRATAEVVSHGWAALPAHAGLAAAIAMVSGLALARAQRRVAWLPSPVALGMAFVLPPYVSLTMALGALGFAILGRVRPAWSQAHAATLASGAIAGEAIIGLVAAAGALLG